MSFTQQVLLKCWLNLFEGAETTLWVWTWRKFKCEVEGSRKGVAGRGQGDKEGASKDEVLGPGCAAGHGFS
jgi:hypothetical protein